MKLPNIGSRFIEYFPLIITTGELIIKELEKEQFNRWINQNSIADGSKGIQKVSSSAWLKKVIGLMIDVISCLN